ncbi:hypothetical protein PAXRUDRAFT_822551 [Paxillus rubicundulus Ve08.2h10]|uniref:Uncharacterized protein n=1 Tax=Paxillus rubicundulus Ve08.2h10 TaxID=930991 RepID=A0A0D0DWD3_9AGAM|nr:hypothetical protein PAXRUDRAFT_822551 [Paxillus rubicundulus Ve08.2h10]
MSRPAQRLLPFLRSPVKVTPRTRPRVAFSRRMTSSESHAGHGSEGNDTPWMIGSALVFGPLFLYLVSPSARKTPHAGHGHEDHRDMHSQHEGSQPAQETPSMTDDEGTEVSGAEVKESMEKGFEVDSPRSAQAYEEAVAKAEITSVEKTQPTDSSSPSELSTDEQTDAASEEAASALEPTPSEPVKLDAPSTSDEHPSKAADEKTESAGKSQA